MTGLQGLPNGNLNNAVNQNINANKATNTKKEPENKSQMSQTTKIAIGAGLAALAAAGIYIATRGKKAVKPELPPEMKPTDEATQIYNEISSKLKQKTKVSSETIDANLKPEENPKTWDKKDIKEFYSKLEKTSDSELAKDAEIASRIQLCEKATPVAEFKKSCKVANGKAVLNNGEPFNGFVVNKTNVESPILLEYKDGIITKTTKFRASCEKIDYVKTYGKDEKGNRVIKIVDDDGNTKTITKVNDTLITEGPRGYKKIASKDKTTIDRSISGEPDIIGRKVIDNKTGKTTISRVNQKTNEIEELVPVKIEKPAHDGIPAYKYSYDGNFQQKQKLEVLNEDGSLEFTYNFDKKSPTTNKQFKLQPKDDVYMTLKKPFQDSAHLTYQNEFSDPTEFSQLSQRPNVINIKILDTNYSSEYDLETKEIKVCCYDTEQGIKEMLKNIFGNKEPISIDKLYERMDKDVTSILKEINQ